jgi:hypothetical protein
VQHREELKICEIEETKVDRELVMKNSIEEEVKPTQE